MMVTRGGSLARQKAGQLFPRSQAVVEKVKSGGGSRRRRREEEKVKTPNQTPAPLVDIKQQSTPRREPSGPSQEERLQATDQEGNAFRDEAGQQKPLSETIQIQRRRTAQRQLDERIRSGRSTPQEEFQQSFPAGTGFLTPQSGGIGASVPVPQSSRTQAAIEGEEENVIEEPGFLNKESPILKDVEDFGADFIRLGDALNPLQSNPTLTRIKEGFFREFFPTTRGEIATDAAILTTGGAVGIGARTGGKLLTKVPKVGGKLIQSTEFGLTLAGGTAVGFEAVRGAKGILTAKSPEAAGGILGRTTKELGLFGVGVSKGTKIADRVEDLIRVRGTQRLPTAQVVAPEALFKGQRFPLIKKGQTAGQLLDEFFKPVLPGETAGVGRGFTASGQPFLKATVIEKGSSEVPGLFQAPLISPNFLRVTQNERAVVGLEGFLAGSSPTAIRLTPESIQLAPGVSRGQRSLSKFNKRFFESIRGTGRSFVPFAKTEKEAVVAVDTPIRQVAKKFSFEFGGRLVPIAEFSVDKTISKAVAKQTGKTLGAVSSSSSRIGSDPKINPLQFLRTSRRSSTSKSSVRNGISSSTISSLSRSLTSSVARSSGGSSRRGRPSISRIISGRSLPSLSVSPSRSRNRALRGRSGGGGSLGSSFGISTRSFIDEIPTTLPRLRQSGRRKKTRQRRLTQRRRVIFAPDLAAVTLNIRRTVSPAQLNRLARRQTGLSLRPLVNVR